MEPTSDIDLAILVREGQEEQLAGSLEDLESTVHSRLGNRLSLLVASVRGRGDWPQKPGVWKKLPDEGIVVLGSTESNAPKE
jgi:hypothetical protein